MKAFASEVTVSGGWGVPARSARGRRLLAVSVGTQTYVNNKKEREHQQWQRLVVPVNFPGPVLPEDVIQFHLQELLDSLQICSSSLTCSKGSVDVVSVDY